MGGRAMSPNFLFLLSNFSEHYLKIGLISSVVNIFLENLDYWWIFYKECKKKNIRNLDSP